MAAGKFQFDASALLDALANKSGRKSDSRDSTKSKYELFLETIVVQIVISRHIPRVRAFITGNFTDSHIFEVFRPHVQVDSTFEREQFEIEVSRSERYPLIVGQFPMGIKSNNYPYESSLFDAVKSSELIDKDGVGLFVLPSWHSMRLNNARNKFNELGLDISAIIRAPFLLPTTAIRPLVVLVEHGVREDVFLLDAEFPETVDISFENFFSHNDTGQIGTGIWRGHDEFDGFERWAAKQRMHLLMAGFGGDLREFLFSEVADDFRLTAKKFDEAENAIYIPLIGTTDSVDSLSKITMKDQNYCQVVLNTEKVLPAYMCSFLNSPYGRQLLALEKAEKGGVIAKLNKAQVRSLQVLIPKFQVQANIVKFLEKFSLLRETIQEIEDSFASNPIETKTLLPVIENALNQFNRLSASDKIRSLIRDGESKVLEFKQTFVVDVSKGTKESYISMSSIKTIAAFLNSDGGVLLIGVKDDGELYGIDDEIDTFFHGSNDEYLLHFKNLFKRSIGEPFYPYVDYELVVVDGHKILRVDCSRSESEVFVDEKDFYVRTNPSTDKLDGPKQLQYIRKRFGQ